MAFTYGFYNSLKGDRKYNAEQMSEIFDGILKDGIIPSQGQLFVVKSAENGMQITVGTGRAWFDHTWSKNDSVMVLTVPQSDITRPRYDAVVLEVNHEQMVRANEIKIVQGESAVNPVKPTLVNTDKVKQYPLAYILVKAAITEIKAEDIENVVGRSPTVFATGVLETVAIDDLWSQWAGEWKTWFDGIKLQLTENVAANLQYQIDQLNAKIPEKATNSEIVTGTNTTKYTTPSGVKAAIDANKNYVKDDDGLQYKLVARNYLPRLNSDDGVSYEAAKDGLVIYLADYAVLHYENEIYVFDQSGNVRHYSTNCTLEMNWLKSHIGGARGVTSKPALVIKGTNSYIALSDGALYHIAIEPSKLTVSLYYTWTSTDGTPVLLGYVNEEWSILVLKLNNYSIRIFKIPNGYVSQPTIISEVSYKTISNVQDSSIENNYGISGQYIWVFIRAYGYDTRDYKYFYVIINGLTGSVVKNTTELDTTNSSPYIYFCDEVDNNFYALCSMSTSGSTGNIQYRIMKCSGSSYTMSDIYYAGTIRINLFYTMIDTEHGRYWFHGDDKIHIVQYRGDVTTSQYTIPEPDVPNMTATVLDDEKINGTFSYIKFYFKESYSTIKSSYMITNPSMTKKFIYLENFPPYGIDHSYSNTSYPSDHPEPLLMIYDRYIYTHGNSGMAKYDMLARDFIGIPT